MKVLVLTRYRLYFMFKKIFLSKKLLDFWVYCIWNWYTYYKHIKIFLLVRESTKLQVDCTLGNKDILTQFLIQIISNCSSQWDVIKPIMTSLYALYILHCLSESYLLSWLCGLHILNVHKLMVFFVERTFSKRVLIMF